MSDFIDIANSFEAPIANALMDIFFFMQNEVDVSILEQRILSYGITGALSYLEELQIEGRLRSTFVEKLEEAINESGRMTFGLFPPESKTGLIYTYSIINPISAQHIRNYEYDLIRLISENTKGAIRQSIQRGLASGVNPKVMAETFKGTLGLTPHQEVAVVNYEKGLRDLDRSVLNRALRDGRFDGEIARAIKNKTPLSEDQIKKFVGRYRDKAIQHRAITIGRTEALRAVNTGAYLSGLQAMQEDAVEASLVRRFWKYTHDARTRDPHRMVPSMNPEGVGLNDPFQTPLGPLLYPQDPGGSASNTINCRCTVAFRYVETA